MTYDNQPGRGSASGRDIRPALADVVRRTLTEADLKASAWMALPGRCGFYPVSHGGRDLPIGRWTIPTTNLTVADVEAAAEQLIAEGLGSTASLTWDGDTFAGSATAWGPTAKGAVGALVDALALLWPDPDLVDHVTRASDRPWRQDEWRTGPTGVKVTAPVSWAQRPSAMLYGLHEHASVELHVDGDGDWMAAMRAAIGVDPRVMAADFAAWHAGRDAPPIGRWAAEGRHASSVGTIRPAGPSGEGSGRRRRRRRGRGADRLANTWGRRCRR